MDCEWEYNTAIFGECTLRWNIWYASGVYYTFQSRILWYNHVEYISLRFLGVSTPEIVVYDMNMTVYLGNNAILLQYPLRRGAWESIGRPQKELDHFLKIHQTIHLFSHNKTENNTKIFWNNRDWKTQNELPFQNRDYHFPAQRQWRQIGIGFLWRTNPNSRPQLHHQTLFPFWKQNIGHNTLHFAIAHNTHAHNTHNTHTWTPLRSSPVRTY